METQAFFGHVSTLGCFPVRNKTFFTHVERKKCDDVRKSGLFTHAKTTICINELRPDGDGGWSRHWLPKEGTHAVGRTGGILRPRPGRVEVPWRDADTVDFITD